MKITPLLFAAALSCLTVSAGFAAKTEEFNATEKVRPPAPKPPENAKVVKLGLGETREVFAYQRKGLIDREEEAFYLPPEAARMLQLIVEKKGQRRVYFVKAHNVGETVGGVVKRAWLDSEGFRPRDSADEARVQAAVKAAPVIFVVEHPPAPATPKR